MSFEDAIRAFDLHLRAERNLSPHTRRAYLADLRQLRSTLEPDAEPQRVTAMDVRRFLAGLHGRRHPSTLARKLAAIRCFFRFLVREGRCSLDPTAGMPLPRTPKRLPSPLPVDDCATLVEPRSGPEGGAMELRDRALVELLYGAGLRVGEMVSLDVRDVDLHRGDVRVMGKGGKERVVPLPAAAREALSAWLAWRRAPGLLAQPLFVSLRPGRNRPRRLGARDVRRILSWIRAQGGTRIGVHGLSLGGCVSAGC